MTQNYSEKLKKCYESVRAKTDFVPQIALILGSGLGDYAEGIDTVCTISYSEIEGFPVSTVSGHKGRFVFGYVQGVPIVAMQGRVHYYEGYAMQDVVRIAGLAADMDIGMAAVEVVEDDRQHEVRQRGGRADLEAPGQGGVSRQIQHALELGIEGRKALFQQLALLVEHQSPPHAHEEAAAQLILEAAQRRGDGRLRDAEQFSHLPHVGIARQRQEYLDMPQGHAVFPINKKKLSN